jgi:hypothetical protein
MNEGLTYLRRDALLDLYDAVRKLEKTGISGAFVEAGCALGGSALTIAFAKKRARALFVYDVFATIPSPSTRDGADAHKRYDQIAGGKAKGLAGNAYYGYQGDLYETVKNTFRAYGLDPEANCVHLVKGRYEDTLAIAGPVAFAHIDCDWYDSVMLCLDRIVPQLVSGGILVIDDYDAWSGCRQAVDDFFLNSGDDFLFRHLSRLHIIRK